MRLEAILNMLGNETRREILQLLSEGPCYVSQVSQELKVGQKAIIEHLELMRRAGILETRLRKIEKGRPRKYYGISQDVILEVKIGHTSFDISDISPILDQELLETLPKLKRITEKLERITHLRGEEKIMELERIHKELLEERENLDTAKRVVEYFLGQIRDDIREETLEKEIKELLF
jgi:ArsR family transcriptional regulator